MSIGQFLGTNIPKLRKANVINGPFERIGAFHVRTAPVQFGTLLKYTNDKKVYAAMAGNEDAAGVALFAGIALVEKAGTPNAYPGTKTRYEIGEVGNVLLVGDVAVELGATGVAANALEGRKVYLGADGKVTTVVTEAKLIPNLVFTGDVEVIDGVTLVGVRKLY